MNEIKINNHFNFATNKEMLEEAEKILAEDMMSLEQFFNAVLMSLIQNKGMPEHLLASKKAHPSCMMDELYAELEMGQKSKLNDMAMEEMKP